MLCAIRYARECKVPYFGICLGMQTMVIEFARNVCGLASANSTEFDPATPDRVIYKLRELKGVDELGGTMRLGAYPCLLAEGSFARRAYGKREISERHRHRYEFNREYEDVLKQHGLRLTGETPDGVYVEICELPGPSLVSRLPVSSRVQIEAAGAASSVPGLHRRGARTSPKEPRSREAVAKTSESPTSGLDAHPGDQFRVGGDAPLALIAGPCVIESEEHVHFLAARDRQNRRARSSSKRPSTRPTGRASTPTADPASRKACAFSKTVARCRYSRAHRYPRARASRRPPPKPPTFCKFRHFCAARPIFWSKPAAPAASVNIKKGQFVSPHDIRLAAEKVASTGNQRILLTERGSSFGYNNLVVDMRGLRDHARLRLAGGVRRHPQRPACPARRARPRRPARIHRTAGARRRGRGRGRGVRRSARSAGTGAFRRRQRVAARPAGRVVAKAAKARFGRS